MQESSIRRKFFVSFSLLGLIALSTSFYLAYDLARESLQTTIKSELKNSTRLITNLVESVATTSIENHLRSVAETQLLQIRSMYEEFQNGHFSEAEAKSLAARTLLKQDIGTSGYFYCIDSDGKAVVHRERGVQDINFRYFPFIQEQIRQKHGYMEYRWKNPGEKEERDKALYMVYFEPWDWIISATTYKSEFTHLIDVGQLNKALSKISFSESGYPFILDTDGNFIYHPAQSGSIYDSGADPVERRVGVQILEQKDGVAFYQWMGREKISFIEFLGDYNWVVASSAYLDELYRPLAGIQKIFLLIFLCYGLLILSSSYGLSTLFTRPLKQLIDHFKDKQATNVKPITASFNNDEVGKLAAYLNQFIDKLKEHHVALEAEIGERRRSEQTFHTLFDNSFQLIGMMDKEGLITQMNKTTQNFFGQKEEDVLGQPFWDMPWLKSSEVLAQQFREAFATAASGRVSRFEGRIEADQETYFDVSVKPVLDDDGQVIYTLAEARDITDLRKAEQELQQVQKMESVGTLAGGIAHDFNNVLGGILGVVDLMTLRIRQGGGVADEELLNYLETIDATALRAKDIVNQLLNLSRKNDLRIVPINLTDVLDQICQIGSNSFDKSIVIEADYATEIPIKGDANSLEQVLLNLCINASHAMTIMRPEGQPWGGMLNIDVIQTRVEKHADYSEGEYWLISIMDTGVGMDDDALKKIFIPFYTTKDKNSGTGLGLSMVYNIVQQHGGFIEVDSEPGAGSRFCVYLPVCREFVEARNAAAEPRLVCGEGLILIIDDEELIRNNAAEILERSGYRVLKAENGQQGLEIYQGRKEEIDLVVLDLVMPVMSGKETYMALKEVDPDVKVLLSSGFRHDSRVSEIQAAGVSGFIQKPYTLFGFSKAVSDVMTLS